MSAQQHRPMMTSPFPRIISRLLSLLIHPFLCELSSVVELSGDSIETRLGGNAREAMSNAEDIDSTYERLDEAFPAPEADEVAGPIVEPSEYVTSKHLKVRPLQWSPVVILILLAGISLLGSINCGDEL